MIKRFFQNLLLVISSIIFFIFSIEFCSFIYIKISPPIVFKNHYDFRMSIPKPYENAPFDVQSFIKETWGVIEFFKPENTTLVIPKNYKSKYMNVTDGFRNTSFYSGKYESTIYLLGEALLCAMKFQMTIL